MRMSLPTPAELEAVRKEIEDLKREAQEAKQLGQERLHLTLLEVLVPLRHKEERLAKGESSSRGAPRHAACACVHPDLGDHIARHFGGLHAQPAGKACRSKTRMLLAVCGGRVIGWRMARSVSTHCAHAVLAARVPPLSRARPPCGAHGAHALPGVLVPSFSHGASASLRHASAHRPCPRTCRTTSGAVRS